MFTSVKSDVHSSIYLRDGNIKHTTFIKILISLSEHLWERPQMADVFPPLMSWNKNWRLLPNKIQWAFWLWELNRKLKKVACIFSLSLFISLFPFTLFSFIFLLSFPPKFFVSDLFLSFSWILCWILYSMLPLALSVCVCVCACVRACVCVMEMLICEW